MDCLTAVFCHRQVGEPRRDRWLAACLSLLLLFCGWNPAEAGLRVWTSGQGPEGGDVSALVTDAANPQVVYAGTRGGGVFKSADGGATWAAANNGLAEVVS